ncbi:MAG: ribosome-binding factor A, partial [Caldilineaceae bacterium]|nr:ribosome-binding factor A [Caldilineaceae bacterium]
RKEVLAGLRSATPYLRSQLASRCGLRMVPEILFYYDDTPERAARIDELLSQIAQERGERTDDETSAPAETGDAP